MIVDSYGRQMRKVRVSLTEACNFHCFYCMPGKSPRIREDNSLHAQDYARLLAPLVAEGVTQIRLTGGEPLLHPQFREIARSIVALPGAQVSLTTNGSLLLPQLAFLQEIGIQKINISLDSLDEGIFHQITQRHLPVVLQSIRAAVQMGFIVKINMVVAHGMNERELLDFVDFAEQEQVEVRFLEMMQIGPAIKQYSLRFIDAQSMEDRIRMRYTLTAIPSALDSTVYRFVTEQGGVIGFMASESKPFCGTCSRLRLSSTGALRACLMRTENVVLQGKNAEQIIVDTKSLLMHKPMDRVESIAQAMHEIGG